MHSRALHALLVCLCLASGSGVLSAQSPPPPEIEMQARLTDNLGVPILGAVTITVLMYDLPAGGVVLWQETHNAIAQNGVVNLRLGSVTAFPPNLFENGDLYATFQVGADPEMSPRRHLSSAPFAIRAAHVDLVGAGTTIAPDLIDSTHVVDASIQAADLAAGAVDSSKIQDGAVSAADLAGDSVDGGKILDGSVAEAELAAGAVTAAKIGPEVSTLPGQVLTWDGLTVTWQFVTPGPDSVDGAAILDGAVGAADLAANAVDGATVLDGSIGFADLASDSVDASKILDGSVGPLELSAGAVTSGAIAAGAVDNAALGADAIDGSKVLDGSLGTFDIGPGTIVAQHLTAGSVTPSKLGTATATAGDVLKYDGAGVSWTGDGVTLPFTDTIGSSQAGIKVSNTGTGPGLLGTSTVSGLEGDLINAVPGFSFSMVGGRVGSALVQFSDNEPYVGGVSGIAVEVDGAAVQYYGVYGAATAPGLDDVAAGVYGEVYTDAPGVYGDSYGVFGLGEGSRAVGVFGRAENIGMQGEAMPTTGTNPIVRGVAGLIDLTLADDGHFGLLGRSTGATLGNNYGVAGVADQQDPATKTAYGVFGETLGNGVTPVYAVYGRTDTAGDFAVFADGDIGATGTKSFLQPHPTDPAKQVRFVCLEGNESGTYFRGSGVLVDGAAVIEVPEEFGLVTEEEGLTVQLTPLGARAALWVESKDLERIVVAGDTDVAFDYFVNGVRRGHLDFEPVEENRSFVPAYRGTPYGGQLAEGQRRILVENGILNPDFTPNEETAARMGWTLADPEEKGGVH